MTDTFATTPHRVVLCDDAIDFVQLAKLLLELEPDIAVVGVAHDGAQAIEVCRELRPDLLLLDVSMPIMDGLTALPLVREASPDTKVVMLTAFDTESMKREAHEAGATGFIVKGVAPLSLPDQVRGACQP